MKPAVSVLVSQTCLQQLTTRYQPGI